MTLDLILEDVQRIDKLVEIAVRLLIKILWAWKAAKRFIKRKI